MRHHRHFLEQIRFTFLFLTSLSPSFFCDLSHTHTHTHTDAHARAPSRSHSLLTTSHPPTHTPQLSEGFQSIVNSYGTARYREVNPAVFTIITFPFEFGIMFGDIGHGFMLFGLALYLLYLEKCMEFLIL